GKHVLCEKALGTSKREVKEIIEAATKNNVKLFEAISYQFHPQHKKVSDIMREKEFGEIQIIDATFCLPERSENIRYSRELGGGVLNDVAVYPIHIARRLFKDEPTDVNCHTIFHKNHDVDWIGNCILLFPENKVARLTYSLGSYYQNYYSLLGAKGKITVSPAFSIPDHRIPTITYEDDDGVESWEMEGSNQYLAQLEYFVKLIDNDNLQGESMNDMLGQATVMEMIRNTY
ncbi:Gfo/Idh/MocA family oxidoreductase, partial [Candidatus Amoebophilus asiaticus]|nr:Gfo/Idh/MocA family oxidoreductase [Candidatus Amoebophilus asiaticus]